MTLGKGAASRRSPRSLSCGHCYTVCPADVEWNFDASMWRESST